MRSVPIRGATPAVADRDDAGRGWRRGAGRSNRPLLWSSCAWTRRILQFGHAALARSRSSAASTVQSSPDGALPGSGDVAPFWFDDRRGSRSPSCTAAGRTGCGRSRGRSRRWDTLNASTIATVAVDVLAGSSLYAAARSAGPRPDGVANGVILLCASVRTRALQENRPPAHTALWGCCGIWPSSSVWRSPSSWRSAVAQLARARAPAAMKVMRLMAIMMAGGLFIAGAIRRCASCANRPAGLRQDVWRP